jgi:hypothetical protein
MRIAWFCLEASRDENGRLRFRFALCVITTPTVALKTLVAGI